MKCTWLAAIAIGLGSSLPAHAQMVLAQDPGSLVAALQEGGYAAKLSTDSVGDPQITSGSGGTTFQIFFYNCTDHKACATVQFNSGYKLTTPVDLDRLNEWNRTKRFGRSFLDKENDPVLQMDVDLDDGGMSRALFIDNVEFWTSILGEFEKWIGYRK